MRIRSLCWEDPLEKEIATHSSILAWKIPWTEEPMGSQSRAPLSTYAPPLPPAEIGWGRPKAGWGP